MNLLDALGTALTMPFMVRALVALLVLGVAAGTVSVFINLRGLEFLSDGLTHAVFPGLAIGFVFAGSGGVVIGALVAAALATAVLTLLGRRSKVTDATIAIVLTAMFSIGVIVVSQSHEVTGQLEQLLFGHVLTLTSLDMWITVGVSLIALFAVIFTRRAQLLVAFDRVGARAAGFRPLLTDVVLNVAIALVVVAASSAVGNLLVLAVLIVPGAFARLWAGRIDVLVWLSIAFALVVSIVGLYAGFGISVVNNVPLPGGATIALLAVIGYGIGVLVKWLRVMTLRKRITEERTSVEQVNK